MSRKCQLGGAVVIALLMAPAVAAASTAKLSFAQFDFNGLGGEVNRVSVTQGPGSITVVDSNSIQGTGTCVHPPNAPRRVDCPFRPGELGQLNYSIYLGDGSDSLVIDTRGSGVFQNQVYDGPGNDSIRALRRVLWQNQTGNDTFRGSPGNDEVESGRGPGNDRVSGNGGNDDVRGGIENDRVDGGAGDDTVNGNDGNDVLVGGSGVDVIQGGKGTDVLFARDGVGETVNCGGGSDTARVDNADRTVGCERIIRS